MSLNERKSATGLSFAQRPIVIGTAGHVDHGKSSLVLALTGTDPDRLAEEKARSMTIDLGFARLELPSGRIASIVDVPGHEHFIKNMLSGVGGIDLALLVVAADEGPMPQTREHLAIIDLLGIEQGVVAVTKSDLVEAEFTDYVVEEIAELLAPTTLAAAPIVPVSSTTGAGLAELTLAIDVTAALTSNMHRSGPPRLPIDRVFTIAGFGPVVTGTMQGSGTFGVGDELVIMPAGLKARVRGLQSHGESVDVATAGMRAAVNLSGVDAHLIQRGTVLTTLGGTTATHRLDAQVRLLDDAPAALTQNVRLDLFTGTCEVATQVTLLEADEMAPGDSQFVQMRLAAPIAVSAGDRLIIRQASPSRTLGGGIVLDARPVRHRRFDPVIIESLRQRAAGDAETLLAAALGGQPRFRQELLDSIGLITGAEAFQSALDARVERGEVLTIGENDGKSELLYTTPEALGRLMDRLVALLARYHDSFPLRSGMPREDMRKEVGTPAKQLELLLDHAAREGILDLDGPLVRQSGFRPRLDHDSRLRADRFLAALLATPVEPPSPADFGIGLDLLQALEHLGEVVCVNESIVFTTESHHDLIDKAMVFLEDRGQMSLAEFRDLAGTTRKYAQPLLEDFDRRRLTRRVGDVRYTGPAAKTVRRVGKELNE